MISPCKAERGVISKPRLGNIPISHQLTKCPASLGSIQSLIGSNMPRKYIHVYNCIHICMVIDVPAESPSPWFLGFRCHQNLRVTMGIPFPAGDD